MFRYSGHSQNDTFHYVPHSLQRETDIAIDRIVMLLVGRCWSQSWIVARWGIGGP